MSYSKTIVVLAASKKKSGRFGRCIAGKEYYKGKFGDWIRPVADRDVEGVYGGLSNEECYSSQGEGYRVVNLYDIVEISFAGADPNLSHHPHQRENLLIKTGEVWKHRGHLYDRRELKQAEDDIDGLWEDGHSSRLGQNDIVPVESLSQYNYSFALVKPKILTVKRANGLCRAEFFLWGGFKYDLAITDTVVDEYFLRPGIGKELSLESRMLCVRLGEPIGGFARKLVTSVIKPIRTRASEPAAFRRRSFWPFYKRG